MASESRLAALSADSPIRIRLTGTSSTLPESVRGISSIAKTSLGTWRGEQCSPRHVPSEVMAIAAVPRTLSGKVLEVPVKRILMGTPPERAASRESLANPEALDFFAELSDRRAGG